MKQLQQDISIMVEQKQFGHVRTRRYHLPKLWAKRMAKIKRYNRIFYDKNISVQSITKAETSKKDITITNLLLGFTEIVWQSRWQT